MIADNKLTDSVSKVSPKDFEIFSEIKELKVLKPDLWNTNKLSYGVMSKIIITCSSFILQSCNYI